MKVSTNAAGYPLMGGIYQWKVYTNWRYPPIGMGSLMGAIHKRDVSTNRSCPAMRGVHKRDGFTNGSYP